MDIDLSAWGFGRGDIPVGTRVTGPGIAGIVEDYTDETAEAARGVFNDPDVLAVRVDGSGTRHIPQRDLRTAPQEPGDPDLYIEVVIALYRKIQLDGEQAAWLQSALGPEAWLIIGDTGEEQLCPPCAYENDPIGAVGLRGWRTAEQWAATAGAVMAMVRDTQADARLYENPFGLWNRYGYSRGRWRRADQDATATQFAFLRYADGEMVLDLETSGALTSTGSPVATFTPVAHRVVAATTSEGGST